MHRWNLPSFYAGLTMAVDSMLVCFLCLTVMTCTVAGQTERMLAYSMYEKTPANTFIAEIPRDAELSLTIPAADLSSLTYSILPQSGEYTEYFSIGERDGVLRTTRRINRDTICYQRASCPLKLDVAVQPREYFRIIKITIAILDQNDNPPVFLPGQFTRSIAENTNPGASFTIPTADDPDSPKYGVKRYEMITGAPQFDLKVTNNTDGSLDLHLVLKEAVDREVRDLYRVVVAAYDGGLPPLSGTLTLDIIILDVNDNNPRFTNDSYTATVPESLQKNSVVIAVKATDIDSGPNGQVVYGFSAKTEHSYGNLFGINNETGEIYIKRKLDFERGATYVLSVTARDMNPESLTTMAKVVVNIEDVNDHPPAITVNALTTSGSVEIPEGESPGSLVAHISVEDPDSGLSGQFVCSLDSSKFSIQQLYGGTEYKIITSDVLDRERESSYDLEFVCADQGSPALTSTALISVSILDENDNAPSFSKQTYSAILPENNEIGVSVIQLNATDPDLNENGRIEYRALGSAGNFLNVDRVSGVVTAQVSFDYEQAQMLEFPIVAIDHGDPPKSSTTTLIITFTDQDDSLPEFTDTSYSFDVYENLPMGAEVGQVTAVDADSPPFSGFMYFMDPDASASDTFMLEPESGRIFTRKSLDREYRSEYQLVIMAVSKKAPSHSSSVRVTIYVADRNDNTPFVVFPTRHNDTVYLEKALKAGDRVSRVIVTDRDIGINSKLTYLITEGNDDGYFGVDSETGVIFVNNDDLSDIEEKIFRLKLQINDNGSPAKTVETIMNIVVNKSLTDVPSSSKKNFVIVVTVVVFSAVLTGILICAIVFIKTRDRRERLRKLKYSPHVVGPQMGTLVLENENKPTAPLSPSGDGGSHVKASGATKRTRDGEPVNKRDAYFHKGEAETNLDSSLPDWDHQIADFHHSQVHFQVNCARAKIVPNCFQRKCHLIFLQVSMMQKNKQLRKQGKCRVKWGKQALCSFCVLVLV